ncbi:MAG TPA: PQQ-binding-like beta-propeller repeat protein [Acidobacteriaceae bacterium]
MRIPFWPVIGLQAAAVSAVLIVVTGNPKTVQATGAKAHSTWTDYEGGMDSAQYSSLTQVNKTNVTQLKQVWFYPAGNNGFRFGFNPVIAHDVMYVVGNDNAIVALDAATGRQIWLHDNGSPRLITNRGINYWESKDGSDRRLFYSCDNFLHAIDARTGQTIDSFGDHGGVDLREGLGRDPQSIRQIESGTPGRVFEDLLIMGSATGEEYGSPPGDLRAFDVRTGKMVWIFHTVPHPGEFGYDTWPKDAWKYIGGTNTWGGITVDEKRGIAYFPLGSATYDFYGADRTGADLFANCILALDARTGKYLWHYQTVHHDLWDYDNATAPKLLTVRHDGKMVDVVAQAGKNGFLYVFDRVTGKPIWPIEERPVPQSDMPGEHSWPTQPYPTAPPPFARQKFTADDIDPYIADPAEREKIRQEILAARNQGIFTPVNTTNTVEMPGNNGGGNWGSGAVDPETGTLYIQSKDAPSMIKLEPKPPRRQMTGSPATQGKVLYLQNCQQCHTAELTGQPPSIPSLVDIVSRIGADRVKSTVANGAAPMPAFTDLTSNDLDALVAYLKDPSNAHVPPDLLAFLSTPRPTTVPSATDGSDKVRYWTGYGYMNSSDGLPAIKPPWSTLTAYDLNKGTIKWQIPLGGVTQLAEKGIKNTGSYWPRGGVVVTAGGLIFSGTKSDSTFRAYDKDTGKEIWATELPAGPEGIPAVYEVGGREYIVISARPDTVLAGTEGRLPARQSGAAPARTETQGYYVFALPETSTAQK